MKPDIADFRIRLTILKAFEFALNRNVFDFSRMLNMSRMTDSELSALRFAVEREQELRRTGGGGGSFMVMSAGAGGGDEVHS